MDKKLYRSLLPLVNDPELYPLLQAYVEGKIEIHRNSLETLTDEDDIKRTQGRVAELRRLQSMREEVLDKAK